MEHETYVSLETAKLLKEAGFDWPTRYSYDLYLYSTEGEKRVIDGFASTFCNEHNGLASMPSLAVAQKWLREVKKVHIEASPENDEYTEWLVCVYDSNHTAYSGYKTYEEALAAAIKECLEQIITSAQQLC